MSNDMETFFHRPKPLNSLTERQVEVALLVAEGWDNSAIGKQLYLSTKTVERHLHDIFQKLRSKFDTKGRNHRCYLALLARDWVKDKDDHDGG